MTITCLIYELNGKPLYQLYDILQIEYLGVFGIAKDIKVSLLMRNVMRDLIEKVLSVRLKARVMCAHVPIIHSYHITLHSYRSGDGLLY